MKKVFMLLLSVLMTLILSGCTEFTVNWHLGENVMLRVGDTELSESETRLVALHYKGEFEKNYQELLGDDFWDMEVRENISYDDYVKEYYVYRECKAILYLGIEGEKRGISLSLLEETDLKKEAEAFYEAMTEDERTYTGASLSDIIRVKSLYAAAEKTVEAISSGKTLEISDEESRVADIKVIRVASEEEALSLLGRLSSGENFSTLARENTLDERIEYTVAKEDLAEELRNIVFSLSSGETSPVIHMNDDYYIIRVTNAYDTLLSQNNKENLLAEARFLTWQDVYDSYDETVKISR